MGKTASLKVSDKQYELSLVHGTEGDVAIDVGTLRKDTGFITIDTGLANTASCSSAITFIDGEKGIVRYRGYPVEELAHSAHYLEVCYLLLFGELPSNEEFKTFKTRVLSEMDQVPQNILTLLNQYPQTLHPMAMLSSILLLLSESTPVDVTKKIAPEHLDDLVIKIFAQFAACVVHVCRKREGLSFLHCDTDKGFVENLLTMMLGEEAVGQLGQAAVDMFNVLLIVHADHEQNCSTSTMRLVSSAQTHPIGALAAAIQALWGASHGGANQAVVEMLELILKDSADYQKYIDKAKDKEDPFLLMGFGHRVYKSFDPRGTIFKQECGPFLKSLNKEDPLLDLALNLERIAREDDYFVKRNLYPNVDFYSGIIYRALGFHKEMFPVIFALARSAGWLSHWREMQLMGFRIGRPRQVYTGPSLRHYSK